MARLKNHFDELVQQGDAAALEQLQDLQSKFQLLADGEEPSASDARDYMNSVIPKAQKHIEDSLAAAESNSSANAAFTSAVKEYSRAAGAQNSAALRDRVLPLFTQIAQAGGPRAKEAQRYVDTFGSCCIEIVGTARIINNKMIRIRPDDLPCAELRSLSFLAGPSWGRMNVCALRRILDGSSPRPSSSASIFAELCPWKLWLI